MRRALVLLAVLLVAGCRGSGSPKLTVFAASSLTEVFQQLDQKARFDFAGSNELALQIEQGAKPDVFAAASPKYAEQLHEKGLIDGPRFFASNRLVIVVPKGNPAHIAVPGDLARPGVKLVLGAAGVPVGDYARKALKRLGVAASPVSEEDDVKGVVGKVALGEADAGIVYATDVKPVADKVRVVELPAQAQPKIRYPIAVLVHAEDTEGARAFVALVLGPTGQAALRAAGFGPP